MKIIHAEGLRRVGVNYQIVSLEWLRERHRGAGKRMWGTQDRAAREKERADLSSCESQYRGLEHTGLGCPDF